jgi:hypothetical protein
MKCLMQRNGPKLVHNIEIRQCFFPKTHNTALENPATVKPPKLAFSTSKTCFLRSKKSYYHNQTCLNKKKTNK